MKPIVVVHERGRLWIERVRGRLKDVPVRVIHSTCRADCLQALRGRRESVVLFDLGWNWQRGLELLGTVLCMDPDAALIALAGQNSAGALEAPLRQLGVTAFFSAPWPLARVLDVVERAARARLPDNLTVVSSTRLARPAQATPPFAPRK